MSEPSPTELIVPLPPAKKNKKSHNKKAKR